MKKKKIIPGAVYACGIHDDMIKLCVQNMQWMQKEMRRLRRALGTYGEHKTYCGKSGANPDHNGFCHCGLDSAKRKREFKKS